MQARFTKSLELIILFYMYFLFFSDERFKHYFLFVGIILTLFGVVNIVFIQRGHPNTFTMSIDSIFLLLLALLYYFQIIQRLPNEKISKEPFFWINTGLIIYLSGAIVLFILGDYIINVLKDDFIIYWNFHNLLGIIVNLLFFVGIWLGAKEGKIKQESI